MGCRGEGVGCKGEGVECRGEGGGCRVYGTGCRVHGVGCKVVLELSTMECEAHGGTSLIRNSTPPWNLL